MKIVIVLALLIGVCYCIPSQYTIPNIESLYQRQQNKYYCGDASLAMVMSYWGRNVSQKEIADVARTSSGEGTSSYDIVRTAQFSVLSNSLGTDKKKHESVNGFTGYPLGLNAAGYSSNTEWDEGLKTAISMDIPVIVLMHYSLEDPGGHFRVVVGYNDNNETFTTLDPWDRGHPTKQPEIFYISYSNFTALWNYTENDSPRGTPFFGVIMWPLYVDATYSSNGNQTTISGKFSYGIPVPGLDALMTIPPVVSSLASLSTPHLTRFQNNQPSSINMGAFTGDSAQTFEWQVECPSSCHGMYNVTVELVITAQVPYTYDKNGIYYPPYNYMDVIGETFTLNLQ